MNCIIIEDEGPAIAGLKQQLALTGHEIHIQATFDSVKKSVAWLNANQTDLIFLDMQLGDGLGFEIFDHVQISTPVIFTTSYDKYAVDAFEYNSLAYILKPVILEKLKSALDKYSRVYPQNYPVNNLIAPLNQHYQQRFIVRTGNSFQSIPATDVAYFHLQEARFLFLTTKSKENYLYDSTVEMLEQRLDPSAYFRINRQFIIGFDSIKKVNVDTGRLKIETEPAFKEELLVSVNKVSAFKRWLDR